MKLPESFIKEGLELAKDARLFSIELNELSRDELIAACAQGWTLYQNHLQNTALTKESPCHYG